jgi:hypothetical protein
MPQNKKSQAYFYIFIFIAVIMLGVVLFILFLPNKFDFIRKINVKEECLIEYAGLYCQSKGGNFHELELDIDDLQKKFVCSFDEERSFGTFEFTEEEFELCSKK